MAIRGTSSAVGGALVGLAGVVLVAVVVRIAGDDIPATIPALLLLVPIAVCSALSGWRVAVAVAVAAAGTFTLAFLAPVGSIRIAVAEDIFALISFVLVAVTVSTLTRQRRRDDDPEAQAILDEGRALLLRGVSHDLRNPISTIRTVSSDLLDASVPRDDSTRAEMLGLVIRESDRLDRIVGNLLSVSQVQAGGLQPQLDAESVEDLIYRCVGRFERLGIRRIRIDNGSDLPDVSADAVQIDQVLTNLLENALRYGPAGTEVVVESRLVAGGRHVEVAVVDDGPGFSPGARANAFRFGAPDTGVAGRSAGLGLTVCKAIVNAHGGTIVVGDAASHGARVAFTLPTEG